MTKTIQNNFSKLDQQNHTEEYSETELEQIFEKEIKMLKDSIPNPRPEMVANLIDKINNLEMANKGADLSTP